MASVVMNRVPLAAPTRLSSEERHAVDSALSRVVSSNQWILGPEVEAFEREFAQYVGAAEVVGVGNGTDALALAFLSLDLPTGSDVLVCASDGGYSATAARMVGLNPVAVDVDPETWNPSVATFESERTPTTTALVVTHLHGIALPLEELDAWRKSQGLALIEDCAQAHGLRLNGDHVGNTGDVATYSFYPTKNLGALGDAGAVAVGQGGNTSLSIRARSLRQYGWTERYFSELAQGRNSRMDELQAAVLRARLPFLDAHNARRHEIFTRYSEILAVSDRARMLGAGLPNVAHHAVVLTTSAQDRESLRIHLDARGIDTSVHYPWLVPEMPGLVPNTEDAAARFPASASLRERILSLPCDQSLNSDEVSRVCTALNEWSMS